MFEYDGLRVPVSINLDKNLKKNIQIIFKTTLKCSLDVLILFYYYYLIYEYMAISRTDYSEFDILIPFLIQVISIKSAY